jgi:Fic family protein
MEYISVMQFAEKFGISERTARNYCASGKIEGAFLTGKTWNIPADAVLPQRKTMCGKASPLLTMLREQKASRLKGGIYHRTQIDLTYNSNHIEGSRLTHDQTRYIFETNTIGISDGIVNVDDIVETVNHFRCFDYIIDHAEEPLSESLIKQLHLLLKTGTSDSQKEWFAVGDYKRLPNEVGGIETCPPQEVHREMKNLISDYNHCKKNVIKREPCKPVCRWPSVNILSKKVLEHILDFHVRFEQIHPFQDGNGRVGRLIMFKECLANGIIPFIITDELKMFYYRGLHEWGHINGYLMDTCLTAQDQYKSLLDYFKISYKKSE